MNIAHFDLRQDILVIAEIGNNHEGNYALAEEMIGRAAEAGVGAVKFQTFRAEYLVGQADSRRFSQLKSFELQWSEFERLSQVARQQGVLFLSTPFDLESARFLNDLVPAFKIASGDNNFYPLLETVAQFGKPVILSGGLATLSHLKYAQALIEKVWSEAGSQQEMAVLHCVTNYPVPPEQANLAAIKFLQQRLGCTIGYSDHTLGVEACLLAVALGARIIEKHFTLDKNYSSFRDHQLSADPGDMKKLVEAIDRVTTMLGQPEKTVQPGEAAISHLVRRSIVAGANLSRGQRLTWPDLTWTRPGEGLPPGEEKQLLGRILKRDILFGEIILPGDVE